MGCGNTKTVPRTTPTIDSDFQMKIRRVQITWQNIKKIDNLGPKIFAQ